MVYYTDQWSCIQTSGLYIVCLAPREVVVSRLELEDSQVRTQMFARVFGPFFLLVPSIIAIRASSQMPVLFHTFASDPMWQSVLGAVLLLWGSVIIAFHQCWRSVAAVLVSLLGWFLTIRGVLILAVPHVYNAAGDVLEQNAIPVVRAIFRFGARRSVPDLRRLGRKTEPRPLAGADPMAGPPACHG